MFFTLANLARTEKVTDGQESDTAKEYQYGNDDLWEITVGHSDVQQTFVHQHKTTVVERGYGIEKGIEKILGVGGEKARCVPIGIEQCHTRQLDDGRGEHNAAQQGHRLRQLVGGQHIPYHILISQSHEGLRQEGREKRSEGQNADTAHLDEKHNDHLTLYGETGARTHHRQSRNTTGAGRRKQGIHKGYTVDGHTGHTQQTGAQSDQQKERRHHQQRRADVELAHQTVHLGEFHQDDNQEIDLDEKQIIVLELLRLEKVGMAMEHIHRKKLHDEQHNDKPFKPRLFQKFFSMKRVEKENEILQHIKAETAHYNASDEILGLGRDIESVVANDTNDSRERDDGATNLQHTTHFVLVRRNVQFALAVRILIA